MGATVITEIRINNAEPVSGELTVERDVQYVESYTATKPDFRWELVDDAGHFHAYDEKGELPTLQTRSVHMECSGVHDDEECEGYDVTIYSCRICGEDIEPKRVPDPGPIAVAGRWTWSAKASITAATFGDTVSVRVTANGAEYFGVAQVTGASPWGVELLGCGPLGRRKHAPKCTCPLISVSTNPQEPEFVLGDPTGCKVHGQAAAAKIEEAKRRARGETFDPFEVARHD